MMGIIKAGQLFVLTSGKYSDYKLGGVFRALKAIHSADKKQWPIQSHGHEIAAKLAAEGWAEELTCIEWRRCSI